MGANLSPYPKNPVGAALCTPEHPRMWPWVQANAGVLPRLAEDKHGLWPKAASWGVQEDVDPTGSSQSLAQADRAMGKLNLAPRPSQETWERVGLVGPGPRVSPAQELLPVFLGRERERAALNRPKTAESCPVSARFRSPSPSLPARLTRAVPAFPGPSPPRVPRGTIPLGQPQGTPTSSTRPPKASGRGFGWKPPTFREASSCQSSLGGPLGDAIKPKALEH